MRKTISQIIICMAVILSAAACKDKNSRPPYQLDKSETGVITVPYSELGGVKTIPVRLNGILMDMVYDTGCSGISLSWHEVQTLVKNGKLTEDDIIGASYTQIADGSYIQNLEINIREIEIGPEGNSILMKNKTAGVKLNQTAPVLLGNNVLDELASVEVDNVGKTIKFNKK